MRASLACDSFCESRFRRRAPSSWVCDACSLCNSHEDGVPCTQQSCQKCLTDRCPAFLVVFLQMDHRLGRAGTHVVINWWEIPCDHRRCRGEWCHFNHDVHPQSMVRAASASSREVALEIARHLNTDDLAGWLASSDDEGDLDHQQEVRHTTDATNLRHNLPESAHLASPQDCAAQECRICNRTENIRTGALCTKGFCDNNHTCVIGTGQRWLQESKRVPR